jgi:hypothetical protein
MRHRVTAALAVGALPCLNDAPANAAEGGIGAYLMGSRSNGAGVGSNQISQQAIHHRPGRLLLPATHARYRHGPRALARSRDGWSRSAAPLATRLKSASCRSRRGSRSFASSTPSTIWRERRASSRCRCRSPSMPRFHPPPRGKPSRQGSEVGQNRWGTVHTDTSSEPRKLRTAQERGPRLSEKHRANRPRTHARSTHPHPHATSITAGTKEARRLRSSRFRRAGGLSSAKAIV